MFEHATWPFKITILATVSIWVCAASFASNDTVDADAEEKNQKFEACVDAVAALEEAVVDFRSRNFGDTKTLILQNQAAFEEYDAACQKGLGGLRFEATRAYLRDRLGGLFVNSSDAMIPFCTAFRLDDARIATAEHCLWDEGGKRMKSGDLRFSLLGQPDQRYAFRVLTDPAPSRSKLADKADVAILELDASAISALPTLDGVNDYDLEIPKDLCGDAYVLIPGAFQPALFLRDDLLPGDWADAVRVDATDACVRRSGHFGIQCRQANSDAPPVEPFYNEQSFKNHRCIVVNCQTYPGMSGAPIIGFDKATGTLFSEGVFIRSGTQPATGRPTCGNLPGMNIGITFPKNAIDIISKEQ